tara:strand:+ start:877 stop:2061 length:1185 start_codon:yes stop_codon:yes gene_type:complete
MHKSITLSLASFACISIGACSTTQTTENQTKDDSNDSVPMTKLTAPKDAPSKTTEAQPTLLAIGDEAPEISIDHWVKGNEVAGFEDGQVYVMEFWATWCGPCISSMPHISALQSDYGDKVLFTGVSSEKELQTVTSFLKDTNKSDGKLNWDRMGYTVAVDPDRSTYGSYMTAAGKRGIPTAFIIDANGKVAWIGHPMSMDEPLSEIVEGTWDLASASEEFKTNQAREIATRNFKMSLRKTQESGDWDAYISAIDTFIAEYGNNSQLDDMKFMALLTGKKDKAAAYAWANQMMKNNWDSAMAMNSMAWKIVDKMPAEDQNLDFALKIALRGCELSNYTDPMILDTLARCYWEMGNRYKAISWQEKAVELGSGSSMDESIVATLNEYKASLANVDE